ncbi:Uncharacterised protein [Candidatus Tiddalikarchaeum anstoanum]|nr:Uncharacterised protein [Candidatus Tiddalikarchaeum anstoanum]
MKNSKESQNSKLFLQISKRLKSLFHNKKKLAIILAIIISFSIVLANAWVTDDAFITFRYVNNFVNGYGLVYNIGERVQGYTHPLWLGLLIIGGLIKIDLFYWSIFIGLLFNCLTVYFFAKLIEKSKLFYFLLTFFLITIYTCSSFVDFQTSGLENSLTNFLLIMLVSSVINKNKLLTSCLYIGLLLLNRLDLIFIVFPVLLYLFFSSNEKLTERIIQTLKGLLPIIIWEVFSIIYYGFLFPNTKYAKAGAYPLNLALDLGFFYLKDFVTWEIMPSAIFVLCLILLIIFTLIDKFAIYFKKNTHLTSDLIVFLIGAVLQLNYVIFLGGDFMRGRFLLPSFFLVITLVSAMISKINVKLLLDKEKTSIFLLILFILCFLSKENAESFVYHYPHNGVVSERDYWWETNSLWNRLSNGSYNINAPKMQKIYNFEAEGSYLRNQAINGTIVTKQKSIGMLGFFAGPNVTVLDYFGLTDAFIARTPVSLNIIRVGHVRHFIPEEYFLERENNTVIENWENPELKNLWKDIRVITQGPIFSIGRIESIITVWTKYGI